MNLLRPLQLLAILCALLSVSCSATYHASGKVTKRGSVQVTHDAKDSGDKEIRAAIRSEFIKRGFTLTESDRSDFVARYSDTWRWNVLMYLSRLEFSLTERKSGQIQAQGTYRNAAVQSYPSAKKVVAGIFEALDAQQAFGQ